MRTLIAKLLRRLIADPLDLALDEVIRLRFAPRSQEETEALDAIEDSIFAWVDRLPAELPSDRTGNDLLRRIHGWERERDSIVAGPFTAENSTRVEELDRLIDRAWERLAPGRGDVR